MNKLFKIFIASFLSATLIAETFWGTQSGDGLRNGTSLANAWSITNVNSSGNWGVGVGKISGGDSLLLTNGFVTVFAVPGSGDVGNPITVNLTGSSWLTNCWPSTGAIEATGRSNIVLVGGPGISYTTTFYTNALNNLVLGAIGNNVVLRNTSNGQGLATTNNSRFLSLINCWDWTIVGLIASNAYTRITHEPGANILLIDESRVGYPFNFSGCRRLTIVSNLIGDGDAGITMSMGNTYQEDLIVKDNILLRFNHSFNYGIGATNAYATNIIIDGNYAGNWQNWDSPGDTQIHLDGLIFVSGTYDLTSIVEGFVMRNNFFDGDVGTRTTGAIFNSMENGLYGMRNSKLYNNVFLCFTNYSWGNGAIAHLSSNLMVFNNTFIGMTNVQRTASTVTLTNLPVDGETITINGVVRTWKNVVGTPATQILIGGTIQASATNLYYQLGSNTLTTATAFSTVNPTQTATNIVVLTALAAQPLVTTKSGNWASISTATSLVNFGGNFSPGGTNTLFYNNIIQTGSGLSFRTGGLTNESGHPADGPNTEYMLTNYWAGNYSDYNVWVGSSPSFELIFGTPTVGDTWLSGQIPGLANWQTWIGNNRGMPVPIWNTAHADPHSITTPLAFDQYGVPSSPANVGTNLTSLASTLNIPELTVDFWGNARPAIGAWMIGAVQSAPTPTPPATNTGGIIIKGKGQLKGKGKGR